MNPKLIKLQQIMQAKRDEAKKVKEYMESDA